MAADLKKIREQREQEQKRDYMVVKENDFIQKASYNLTAEQQKLLAFVISKIKPTDKEFERYTISALDFANLAGIDPKNAYRDFKAMIEALDNKATWIKIGDDTIRFRVFSEGEYNERQGSISVVLNSRLKKYLLELSHNYTSYELWNILSLKSKHSIRLYELFKSYEYQHDKTFDYEELKSLLCVESYKVYSMFLQRVLNPALEEINLLTNLNVTFEPIRKGQHHKTVGIRFLITKKKQLQAYQAYRQTAERINKRNGEFPGQLSLFDLYEDDF